MGASVLPGGQLGVHAAVQLDRDDVVSAAIGHVVGHVDRERRVPALVLDLVRAVDPHVRQLHRRAELDEDLGALRRRRHREVLPVPHDAGVRRRAVGRIEPGRVRQIDESPRGVDESLGVGAGHVTQVEAPVGVEVQVGARRGGRRVGHDHCVGRDVGVARGRRDRAPRRRAGSNRRQTTRSIRRCRGLRSIRRQTAQSIRRCRTTEPPLPPLPPGGGDFVPDDVHDAETGKRAKQRDDED